MEHVRVLCGVAFFVVFASRKVTFHLAAETVGAKRKRVEDQVEIHCFQKVLPWSLQEICGIRRQFRKRPC